MHFSIGDSDAMAAPRVEKHSEKQDQNSGGTDVGHGPYHEADRRIYGPDGHDHAANHS